MKAEKETKISIDIYRLMSKEKGPTSLPKLLYGTISIIEC